MTPWRQPETSHLGPSLILPHVVLLLGGFNLYLFITVKLLS